MHSQKIIKLNSIDIFYTKVNFETIHPKINNKLKPTIELVEATFYIVNSLLTLVCNVIK